MHVRQMRWAVAALVFAAQPNLAAAGTFTVLYRFSDASTGGPIGRLYLHDGALYGTGSGYNSPHGDGQVFQLKKSGDSWKLKTLLAFTGSNGSLPRGGLIADDAGVFYGTASAGGAGGYGTVFKLWKSGSGWQSATLRDFAWNDSGGTEPDTDLIIDSSGALIGTTLIGGENQGGTVFSLVPRNDRWKEKVLYRFTNNYDGYYPWSGVLQTKSGTLYGTTYHGGMYDYGTVYQLKRSGGAWTETKIHTFDTVARGVYPVTGVIEGPHGTLFGTTLFGGQYQYGTVFSLKRSGDSWTHTIIHEFGSGKDGQEPYGGLLRIGDTLYGTAEFGGTHGSGIIFSLAESGGQWTETVLYNFAGAADGGLPTSAMITDGQGNLYGTAFVGGVSDGGTIWEFTP